MQRGQVALARAYTTTDSHLNTNKYAHMSERRLPPPPPRASSLLPNDQDQHNHFRPGACGYRQSNSAYNKTRKLKQPCRKFGSKYGCPFGDKCHYSHDFRAFYPDYYETLSYGNPLWSDGYAMSRQTHQNYLQQSRLADPPSMPKSLPARQSCLPSKRERASLFANHWNTQPDCIEKLFFEQATLKQIQVEQLHRKHHEAAAFNTTEAQVYTDANRHTKHETIGRDCNLTFQVQPHHRPTSTHSRKCVGSGGSLNSAIGEPPEFYLDSNYLFSPVVDQTRAQRTQQQPQVQEQQCYPRHLKWGAAQQVQSVGLSYTRYLAEEHFYSNLSGQVEAYVDVIDATLVSMKKLQQEAIASLQELVCSLWPDAFIEIYGSSYTQLALPVSDIDCVLVARSLAEERSLVILEALAAAVERQPWTKSIELLGSAKIPVLKMTYSLDQTKRDVLLDLTCGHSVGHTGLGARDLIYSMQLEMPALRPLILILKSHLVTKHLNCAFTGGISSYVLVILVIRFLQACGDTHMRSYGGGKIRGGNRRRSISESEIVSGSPEETVFASSFNRLLSVDKPKWCYIFSRGGRVTWHTSIGSLVMLFLETYITFDYRRFGISIENKGDFFVLSPDKIVPMQRSVVIPYVADPIKSGRSICNCFRMHEVIQSWLALYQNLAAGAPVATCIGENTTPLGNGCNNI